MAKLNDCPKFDKTKNDYYTKKDMWENISHLVPKSAVIWEACLLNSKSVSMDYWKEMGYNIVGNNTWDCLNYYPINYDMIITNPPFEPEIKQKILKQLVKIDKPFIIILNCMTIYSKFMRDIFGDNIKHLQQIIPAGKIKYEVYNEETKSMEKCKDPAFYSCYLAYKMNIPNEDLWLKYPEPKKKVKKEKIKKEKVKKEKVNIEGFNDILDYEGLYKINKEGEVYSVKSKKILKSRKNPCYNYYDIILSKNKIKKFHKINDLIKNSGFVEEPEMLTEEESISNEMCNNSNNSFMSKEEIEEDKKKFNNSGF